MAYQMPPLGDLGQGLCMDPTLERRTYSEFRLLFNLHSVGLYNRVALLPLHLFPFHDTRKFGPRRLTFVCGRVLARLLMLPAWHDFAQSRASILQAACSWQHHAISILPPHMSAAIHKRWIPQIIDLLLAGGQGLPIDNPLIHRPSKREGRSARRRILLH